MIKLYTMPKCSSCKLYKRRLREWNTIFEEHPLTHLQNLYPTKIWTAPILMVGDTIYEYESIKESRDKLWKAIEPERSPRMATETSTKTKDYRKEVDETNKTRIKKNKKKTEATIKLSKELDEKITKTMQDLVGSTDIVNTIEEMTSLMTEDMLFSFMIGWRLANHSNALAWEAKAMEFENRVKLLDPYHQNQVVIEQDAQTKVIDYGKK